MVDVGDFDIVDIKGILHRAAAAHDQAVALVIDFRYRRQAHQDAADIPGRAGSAANLFLGEGGEAERLTAAFTEIAGSDGNRLRINHSGPHVHIDHCNAPGAHDDICFARRGVAEIVERKGIAASRHLGDEETAVDVAGSAQNGMQNRYIDLGKGSLGVGIDNFSADGAAAGCRLSSNREQPGEQDKDYYR